MQGAMLPLKGSHVSTHTLHWTYGWIREKFMAPSSGRKNLPDSKLGIQCQFLSFDKHITAI